MSRLSRASVLLDAALDYAGMGFPVLPLRERGKPPLTKHGYKDATTAPDQIRSWWGRRPGANVGLAVPSSFIVLDLDNQEALQKLRAQDLSVPTTASATTGRGQHHWYTTGKARVKNRVALFPDVDVRAIGGYVVAPPSIHPNGGTYRWIVELASGTVTECPEWLLTRISEGRARPEAPELPEELIPPALRPWILDIGERMQVRLEMVAVPALLALAGVLGRRTGIHPKANDNWLVVPSLWGGIVARPGKMKSPTLAETLKLIRLLASEAQQDHQAALDAAGARLDSLKAKESAIKENLKRLFKGTAEQSPDALEAELVSVRGEIRVQEQASQERRYIVNDTTVEKLGELFKANPWGLLLERDELAGWLRALERDDRRGNREFFLEAWNGNNPYTYDRIGRGTIHVPALCLSIVGGIQPTKFARYISEAVDGGFAADGLLQRFQLLVWPEDRKGWSLVDASPDLAAHNAAYEIFHRIVELDGPGDGEPIPALRFEPEAQALFYEWLTELEQRLHSDEMRETPAFESHLAKYRSLMPSLALLFHLIETDDFESPVPLAAAQLAADWCGFLEQHARKVYAAELQTDHVTAHALAQKIRQRSVYSGMTVREIYNAGWSKLKSAERVLEGMAVLEAHGWARIELVKTGGRPKQLVAVNPNAVEGA